MKKLLLFFSLSFIFLNASELAIQESIFIDQNSSITLEEILTKKEQFKPIKKYNMGIFKDTVWIKLQIKNKTNKNLAKRLYNQRYRLDFIDVYILKNNNIVDTYKLGASQKYALRDNHFRASYFDIKLKPLEKIEIFIKQKTFSTMEVKWHITNKNEFNGYFAFLDKIYFTVLGMIVVIVIASMMLFFLLKSNYYIIYSLFALCSVTYQFSLAGYFYEFKLPLYFNTISLYVVSELAVILLGVFPFSFFRLRKDEYKILSIIIKTIIVFKIFIVAGYFLYPLNNNFIYNVQYGSLASMILMIILFMLSIRTFIDKRTGSAFYLLANVFLTSAAIYFVLGLQGIVSTTTILYYSLAIGVIGQDFFLALALVYATYKIKRENEKQKELVDEYSKLSFLGQTVINIYHQWKSPVNNIYNSINYIETAKEFNDKNLHHIIDENLNQIKQNTQYLKETSTNYLSYYKGIDQPKTKFNLKDEIETILNLHKQEIEKLSIKTTLECDNIELYSQKNILTNILIILVENIINVCKLRVVKNPKFNIVVTQNQNDITINITDNLGGIKEQNINNVFEKNHSVSSSTGLGLYLAKEFLIPKLGGNISVKNIDNGAEFKVSFQK
jgi:signal transduction histidine kinase